MVSVLELLRELCSLGGVSGVEDEVRAYISRRAGEYADEIKTDAIGNLMALRKGKRKGRTLMLCAHMDEVGLIVKNITDDGFLKFGCCGGIDRRVLIGRRVRVGEGKTPGVIGIKAYHHVSKSEEKNVPKIEDMYIDVGASNREEGEKLASLGDRCVFESAWREFGQGFIKARALDDRVGCAVLLTLLESEPAVDTWFVFTAQEEVGTRGATCAAYALNPDAALIVEGTTAADTPSAEEHTGVCRAGGGVVLPFMDRVTIYDRGLFELLRSLADEHKIPWQRKEYISGGTDGAAVQRSRSGVRTAGIAAPVRYIHSPASVVKKDDLDAVLRLAGLFIDRMGESDV